MFWLKAVKMTANKREFLFSNNSFPCCYAPINVKPTGGGGGGQGRVAIWHFSKIYSQIPCQRANHSSQMQPISPPRAAHCAVQYPKAGPNCKKGTIKKISPNKTLKSLFILRYCITKDTCSCYRCNYTFSP